jgi:hypothetical protein
MRCVCCNKALSDYEATRRHAVTGEFLDTCNTCFSSIEETTAIPYTDRPDLLGESDFDDVGVDNDNEL